MNKDKLQIFKPIDARKIEEERILKKYPQIFRQKDLSMKETCMCWGLEIGLGWMPLVDCLCGMIQAYINHNKLPQLEAVQVKEKFGGLRFYVSGGIDNYIDGMIELAGDLSYFICEDCGTMRNVSRNIKGWVRTLCPECRKKNEKRNNWDIK